MSVPTLLVLSFLGGSLEPVVLRHDRSEEESRTLAARFDGSVALIPDGSGTLISERWILTAAHVARRLSPFSPRAVVGGRTVPIRRVLLHPESWSEGDQPPRVDLALLELAAPITDVDPVPLYAGVDEVGRRVVVVGYGDFGHGDRGLSPADGVRRAATNVVDAASDGLLRIDFDAPPLGTELEGVGAPGDSGGSLYLETEQGLRLVGVSSASMGGRPGSYGLVDLYVRVSSYLPWIHAAPEQAPARVRASLSLEEGFPLEASGELLEAFFEVLRLGDRTAVQLFLEDFGSTGGEGGRSGRGLGARIQRLATEYPRPVPARLADLGPEGLFVLAHSEPSGRVAVRFVIVSTENGPRLLDVDHWPEPPPSESDR